MFARITIPLLFAAATTGCASIQDFHYEQCHKFEAHWSSMTAPEVPFFDKDFKHGWRQGYYDFSTGRACKPPVLPPKEYWAPCYQSCHGQAQIAQWYAGYQKGMIAAEKKCGNCFHIVRPHLEHGSPGLADLPPLGPAYTSDVSVPPTETIVPLPSIAEEAVETDLPIGAAVPQPQPVAPTPAMPSESILPPLRGPAATPPAAPTPSPSANPMRVEKATGPSDAGGIFAPPPKLDP
ncbi:MAG: hypothetical protein JNL96_03460 [Planctomycetaceae bacterium]|nr:hypothetical protein [Planctomycetaceae bacterium]